MKKQTQEGGTGSVSDLSLPIGRIGATRRNAEAQVAHASRTAFLIFLLALTQFMAHAKQDNQQDNRLKTRAELTNYEETSRYEDVMKFISELQKRTPLLRVETFGKTEEGRELPLMIFADPPIAQPREALASGKTVIFIMANIHAGEVEGKEAVLHLSRRIAFGDLKVLLNHLVILIAPIDRKSVV